MWRCMICSSILHTTEVSETGLYLSVDILLPFLNIATILAVLHNVGVVPVVSDVVNISYLRLGRSLPHIP